MAFRAVAHQSTFLLRRCIIGRSSRNTTNNYNNRKAMMISTSSSLSSSSFLSSSFLLKGRTSGSLFCNRMIRMPQHTKHIRLGNKNHISTSTTAAIGGGSSSSAGKTKQRYLCQDCGEDYSQWYGQCPGCKAWDSMKVFREPISNANGGSNKGKSGGGAGAAAAQRAQSNNTDRELKSSSSLMFI